MKLEIHSKQDERIYSIIKDISEDDCMKALELWKNVFKSKLKFPFEAEVIESDPGSTIVYGDKVKVIGIGMVDDLHGIIVDVKKERKKYAFELCLLEVIGEDKGTKELVDDYSVWFCNR